MARRGLLAAAALVASGLIATAPGASAQQAAAAARDWTRTVAATPQGGFRIGNPAAPVKLVEYGSLTCDHCARFETEGVPQLMERHVRSGRVSYEFRNFIRDPADLAAALLARCAGSSGFFPLTHDYLASQQQWMARIQAQRAAINALPQDQRLARAAAIGGLDAGAAKAGLGPAKARQCLADEAGARKLAEMRKTAAETHKVQGTPSFLVNGKLVAAHDWASLEPLLKSPEG